MISNSSQSSITMRTDISSLSFINIRTAILYSIHYIFLYSDQYGYFPNERYRASNICARLFEGVWHQHCTTGTKLCMWLQSLYYKMKMTGVCWHYKVSLSCSTHFISIKEWKKKRKVPYFRYVFKKWFGHEVILYLRFEGRFQGKINPRLSIVLSQEFSSLLQSLSRNTNAASTDSHIDIEFAFGFFLIALVSRWEYCKYFFGFLRQREGKRNLMSTCRSAVYHFHVTGYITALTTTRKRIWEENTGRIRGVDYRWNHTAGNCAVFCNKTEIVYTVTIPSQCGFKPRSLLSVCHISVQYVRVWNDILSLLSSLYFL